MNTKEIKEVFEAVVEELNNSGYEASFYDNYSGRAMYGKTCPGIVTNASATLVGFMFAYVATQQDIELDVVESIVPKRWDNMGLEMIYY